MWRGWKGKDKRREGERGNSRIQDFFFRSWGDPGRGDPKGQTYQGWSLLCSLCLGPPGADGLLKMDLPFKSNPPLNAHSFNVLQAPTSGTCSQKTSQSLRVRDRMIARKMKGWGTSVQRKGAAMPLVHWCPRNCGLSGLEGLILQKSQIQIFNLKSS